MNSNATQMVEVLLVFKLNDSFSIFIAAIKILGNTRAQHLCRAKDTFIHCLFTIYDIKLHFIWTEWQKPCMRLYSRGQTQRRSL